MDGELTKVFRLIGLLTILVVVVALFSCGYHEQKPQDPVPPPPPGQNIKYSQVKDVVITPVCMNCHGGGLALGGVELDSLEKVMKYVIPGDASNSKLCQVVDNGSMPPGLPLQKDLVQLVCDWIEQGAEI